ncbi:PREDICTED: ragulator complex protein LAMTOR3-A isoform X2 [Acromyrmex echinatior]|uniref:ragulator complex protein LAMTOR3-A isoform X2 n=1 Tax=Acromyrmex echinatior TaxID=103372 RepID=UPI000580E422|nr:PREDICTED: ragulator complex protein LAMTOR3-A isoform X2 [Acromyrmex echinatior]
MTVELKKFLYGLLTDVEGLHSILITDRDGVPVISVANEKAPELATRASFLSTFGMATDQGSKLGLGKNKTIICMYSNYQKSVNMPIREDRSDDLDIDRRKMR